MIKKPLVSILTLVYNHAHYIKQTIHSVLQQTYQNWEWIILDDGSTDGTGDIIKRIKDGRIKYILQENTGFNNYAKNYSKVFRMSNGDLIAMLDGDDYWPDYKLDVQVKSFDDLGIVLSYGRCCLVNREGKKIGYMDIPDDASIAQNNPIGTSLKVFMRIVGFKRYPFIHNSTVMLRKSALLSIGGFIYAKGAQPDILTWIRLSLDGRFSPIPVCLGYWRRYSSCGSFGADQLLLFEGSINFFREFLLQNEKRLDELGFFYDMDSLEKRWEDVRREFIVYQPYNRAMLMLKLGSFKEAKDEFKKFLEKNPSIKSKLIYFLIILSAIIKFDVVHSLIGLKERLRKIFNAL